MSDPIAWLRALGVGRGHDVAIALHDRVGLGLAVSSDRLAVPSTDPLPLVAMIEHELGPRWVWWDRTTSDPLADAGVPIARSWDVLTVHRLLCGTWRTSIAGAWAWLDGLAADSVPTMGQLDLLSEHGDEGDPDVPVRPDGHLRPEWIAGGWASTPARLAAWADVALEAHQRQRDRIATADDPARVLSTAHSESAAEFLCAELSHRGLPIDVDEALRIIGDAVGPRPTDDTDAQRRRDERDRHVLCHLGPGPRIDLRNPSDVKAMLRQVGVDVPDTRASRLERHRDDHPVVAALLEWRKAERIATTYGYRWLDEHVRDGRLRGEWSSSDGAAGRMTASSGLHNLPAEMRSAVAAEPGHVFVRADLGQIEPRVLAAVSGDPALIAATADDDLYQPVARRLRVDRSIAKVAVLGAMYGATTGESAHALRGLEREYPVAMKFLSDAASAGQRGDDVFTIGGRRVRMWVDDAIDGDIDRARRVAAARGRFARNAVIQGAAAEFFKVWAIIVRARGAAIDAEIVLCLHDELIVQVRDRDVDAATQLLADSLAEAAHRWSPSSDVRFVADIGSIHRWSEAKG